MTEHRSGERRSASGYDLEPLDADQREQLASSLSEEERRVLLSSGTEAPFCGGLLDSKTDGTYACKLCGLPLFSSTAKFDSGTGWPSFHSSFDPDHVIELVDDSNGMVRTEIRCGRCDGHLGHVFPGGPLPRGLRYCLNSVSMDFFPEGEEPIQKSASKA